MMSTSVGTSKPTEEVDGDKAEVVAEVEPQSEEDQAALGEPSVYMYAGSLCSQYVIYVHSFLCSIVELKEKEAADKHSAAVMRAVEDHVFKLLKALHVCSRYTYTGLITVLTTVLTTPLLFALGILFVLGRHSQLKWNTLARISWASIPLLVSLTRYKTAIDMWAHICR